MNDQTKAAVRTLLISRLTALMTGYFTGDVIRVFGSESSLFRSFAANGILDTNEGPVPFPALIAEFETTEKGVQVTVTQKFSIDDNVSWVLFDNTDLSVGVTLSDHGAKGACFLSHTDQDVRTMANVLAMLAPIMDMTNREDFEHALNVGRAFANENMERFKADLQKVSDAAVAAIEECRIQLTSASTSAGPDPLN